MKPNIFTERKSKSGFEKQKNEKWSSTFGTHSFFYFSDFLCFQWPCCFIKYKALIIYQTNAWDVQLILLA